jgi:hypothetical protein
MLFAPVAPSVAPKEARHGSGGRYRHRANLQAGADPDTHQPGGSRQAHWISTAPGCPRPVATRLAALPLALLSPCNRAKYANEDDQQPSDENRAAGQRDTGHREQHASKDHHGLPAGPQDACEPRGIGDASRSIRAYVRGLVLDVVEHLDPLLRVGSHHTHENSLVPYQQDNPGSYPVTARTGQGMARIRSGHVIRDQRAADLARSEGFESPVFWTVRPVSAPGSWHPVTARTVQGMARVRSG